MEPIPIPTELLHPEVPVVNFGPPPNHEDIEGLEDCGTLPTQLIENHCVSYWLPREEELARILEGKPIVLGLYGTVVPTYMTVME